MRRLGKERLARVLIKLGFRTNISTLTDNIYQRAEDACTLLGEEDAAVDYKDLQDRISSELRVFKTLEKEIGKVDDKIKELYQSCFPKKRLNSIPGIADIIGPSIASFIGDAERFSSGKSLVGYFGFYPKQEASGLTSKKGLKMTKAGPNIAKGDLYLAANTARLRDPELGKIYYEQKVWRPFWRVLKCGSRE